MLLDQLKALNEGVNNKVFAYTAGESFSTNASTDQGA
jgi:hypothetical protein